MTERPILFNGPMVRALREGRKTVTRRTAGLAKINAHPDAWELIGPGMDNDFAQFDSLLKPGHFGFRSGGSPFFGLEEKFIEVSCPFGVEGDRLWTRETWRPHAWKDGGPVAIEYAADNAVRVEDGPDTNEYDSWLDRICAQSSIECERAGLRPDGYGNYSWEQGQNPIKWRPSIHMPRWASRDTMEVISARPERLHAITRTEAVNEGAQVIVSATGCPPGKVSPQLPISPRVDSHPLWSARRSRTEDDWYTGYFALMWEETNGPGSWAKNPWVWRVAFRRIEASA